MFGYLSTNSSIVKFLIYPYWNVNKKLEHTKINIKIVSNLSILECKFFNIILLLVVFVGF